MELEKILSQYRAAPEKNKPLKLCHNFPYHHSMAIGRKAEIIRGKLAEFKDKGYGGVVTNVNFRNYLEDDEEWQLFRYTLQTCREMGLRVWIYDEKAYPSGGAGGITLRDHPEYEAQAVAIKTATAAPGEKISIVFPRRHSIVLSARAYRAEGLEKITDRDVLSPYKIYDIRGSQSGIADINDTDGPLTVVYFVQKPMYEGAHAIHNVAESRRYIDVSSADAVRAFIENTYKKYEYYSKGCAEVEAFFTDEPSYMGGYLNFGLFPESVHDEFDETMELLPIVNWGADVENRFKSKLGYDIIPRLVYLFTGKTKLAKQTRLDFYETLSELYENNFFGQISDFCARMGVSFSGHALLEDDIRYHPVFEGNFFSLLRHMHIPGIDMLHGVPENIRADAFTPKLVSSIAHTYNRPHVMSEVSAHIQGGKVTPEQMTGAVTTQYALGVDVFTSYFGDNALPTDRYRLWNDTVGRIDCIMGGGRHVSKVAVYYPIETAQANYIPGGGSMYEEVSKSPENTACWRSLREIYNNLLNNQLDFDFLDRYAVERAEISGSQINTTGDEHFDILILPACYVSDETEVVVRHLGYKGVKVIALQDEEFSSDIAKLRECGADIIYNVDQLSNRIKEIVSPELSLSRYCPEIIYLCRENKNGRSMLIVNTADKKIEVSAAVGGMGDEVTLYDPQSDAVLGKYASSAVPLEFSSYSALMILQN